MRARSTALTGSQYPKTCAPVKLSEICRDSGGVLFQEVSPADSDGTQARTLENAKNAFWGFQTPKLRVIGGN
jgi:hypothetical protein